MSTLTKVGFQRCKVEHTMFYQFDQDAMILEVDVDNITIVGNSPRAIKWFKNDLSSRYGIKDMVSLQWLLGIGIKRDREKRMIYFSKPHTSRRSSNTLGQRRQNCSQFQ